MLPVFSCDIGKLVPMNDMLQAKPNSLLGREHNSERESMLGYRKNAQIFTDTYATLTLIKLVYFKASKMGMTFRSILTAID